MVSSYHPPLVLWSTHLVLRHRSSAICMLPHVAEVKATAAETLQQAAPFADSVSSLVVVYCWVLQVPAYFLIRSWHQRKHQSHSNVIVRWELIGGDAHRNTVGQKRRRLSGLYMDNTGTGREVYTHVQAGKRKRTKI